MNIEKTFFEKRESEPKHNTVVVDFLRHGTTDYLENYASQEDVEMMNGKYPKDLTEKGEQEVIETAKKIVDTINPETDIVVLWSSPKWRAQGSEEIIKEMLEKRGIPILKDSSIESMRSFDQHDKDFMNDLWAKIAPIGNSAETMYARDPEFQEKNEKFESQPEVKKRAERVFNWIRYLAERANLNGKRLRIIGASHFEFINPIMEDIFGQKVEEGKGVQKGEDMQVIFDFNKEKKEMKISADFRGEHKDNISFDIENRKFIISK